MQQDDNEDPQRHQVLNVFGLKMQVSNPRLAELLTMDARQALTSDVRELVGSQRQATQEDVHQALPDVVLSPPTPHSEDVKRLRKEFRQRAEAGARGLGLEVCANGMWLSKTGVSIMSRTVERPSSLAAAAHFVSEVSRGIQSIQGAPPSVLFIVEGQQTAQEFTVAIRQGRHAADMRTISIDSLEDLRTMYHRERLTHEQVLTVLVPAKGIDAGDMVALLRSGETMSTESPGIL
ncbi:MAG: hypothetical protein JXE06_04465 [Coriobacteriia bacterium]|nr:hypothetical protein [Coriobacteriia bacterium]MBN2823088.1 hypothetical protein [Coriobacteriia bacterium]